METDAICFAPKLMDFQINFSMVRDGYKTKQKTVLKTLFGSPENSFGTQSN